MFSERLREARKAKHYSQAEVSRLLGVTQLAACCGTITNELLSRLGMRLPIVSG